MATDKRITYKQFDELLRQLGFSSERVEPKWIRYEHADSQLVIVVVAREPHELVRVTDAVSARRHLVEKGVIRAEALDDLLSRSALAGASGNKA